MLILFALAVLGLSWFAGWFFFGGPESTSAMSYLIVLLLNAGLALTVGFFMWWFQLWAAGDAKLFSMMAFVLPFTFYRYKMIKYFPSFDLIYCIFNGIKNGQA